MKKQTSFFKSHSEFSASRISHGGAGSGRRKTFRPLDRKRPLHIVLKSSHARGERSLLARKLAVKRVVEQKAALYDITIHGFQNMGNHLHLLVSFKARKSMQTFLRVVSGLVARIATGARKGRAFGHRFWDHLVFTRIVTGRRDFETMSRYMTKNEVERECGPSLRQAIELHEKARREARRRGLSIAEIMEDWLRRHAETTGR
jgi:REP element-mobilizing transposase RayT